jgi:hypothetical protein
LLHSESASVAFDYPSDDGAAARNDDANRENQITLSRDGETEARKD